MSIDCTAFLDSAEALLRGTSEVDLRNAASRAYYSVYHACKDLASSLPDFTGENIGGVHAKLIRRFENCPITGIYKETGRAYRSLGYQLQQMKAERTRADYELHLNFDQNRAETAIAMAHRIFAKVSALSGSASP